MLPLRMGMLLKKDLECLGGLVRHCSYLVRGGWTFSRRIFNLTTSYSRHAKRIPLDQAIKADFDWWLTFCYVFNGRVCIIKDFHSTPLSRDSSFMCFEAYSGSDWIAGFWNPDDQPPDFPVGCGHVTGPLLLIPVVVTLMFVNFGQ